MYIKTRKFIDRLEMIGSSSCRPTSRFQNAVIFGAKENEFYSVENWSLRRGLVALREEIIGERKKSLNKDERRELRELEISIEKKLAANRALRPPAKASLGTHFMCVAQMVLNQAIFEEIKATALKRYAEDIQQQTAGQKEDRPDA